MDEEVEAGLSSLQAEADAVTALQDKIMHDLQVASEGAGSHTHTKLCLDHDEPGIS